MPLALAQLNDLLMNAQVDQEAWQQLVSIEEKARADAKLNQSSNFSRLVNYGIFGEYNPSRNDLSIEQLRKQNPQELLDLLKNLAQYEHTLLYYGPDTENALAATMNKLHKTKKVMKPVPVGKHYMLQATPKNEIIIAPYDAVHSRFVSAS